MGTSSRQRADARDHSVGFVRGLCVALRHRWVPESLFVILTAYLDEGYTHDDSPVTVVAGSMASARQWAAFEGAFRAIKKKYGFKVFHTRKFKRKSGEFKGWSNEKCLALIRELYELTSESFMESAIMVLDNAAYEAEYKAGDAPRKLRLDSKYGMCVHNCIMHFVYAAERRKHRGRLPTLHFVLEAGHKNAGDALRIFGEMKKALKGSELDVLGDLTFADKENCDPLMAGDFLSHSQGTREVRIREGKPVSQRDWAPELKNKGFCTVLTYEPGSLSNLKRQLVEGHKEKLAKASGKRSSSASRSS